MNVISLTQVSEPFGFKLKPELLNGLQDGSWEMSALSVLSGLKPHFSCQSPDLSSTNPSLFLTVKHSLCEETHEGAGLVDEADWGKRDVPGNPLLGRFLDGQESQDRAPGFFYSLLEYTCFTMLCSFPQYNKVNHPYTYVSVQYSRWVVSHSASPWTAACQASLSITNSQSLLKLRSIESVMPSSHLTLCRPLLFPPQSFPGSGSFPMYGGDGGLVTKSCLTPATSWAVAHQASLSMGFSRQEYWSGLPFHSPGDLPDPGI